VEVLVQMVLKVSEDVEQIRKNNDYIKYDESNISASVSVSSVHASKSRIQ
jgi:hypothetical protein